MLIIAILIGIYSYILFFLGLIHLLYSALIISFTIVFISICCIYSRRRIINSYKNFFNFISSLKTDRFLLLLFLLLLLTTFVNFIGALGPELAFDALWYHLTFPKLYLSTHAISHIPGGLLYYSDMPKLAELLFTGVMAFGNEIWAKVLHLIFGLASCFVIYKLSRRLFSPLISLLAVVIFYANLVVAWESTTAYIDLVRTFFEISGVYALSIWWKEQKIKWVALAAILMGLAVATKLLAFGSAIIFVILLFWKSFILEKNLQKTLKSLSIFTVIVLLIPMPWFIFAYIHTGNPVFPFFTKTYEISASSPNPFMALFDIWNVLLFSSDPVSPIYLMTIPLIVIFFKKMKPEMKMLIGYLGLSLIIWYFTPRTGGGRFLLPYLPAFSIIVAAVIQQLQIDKKQYGKHIATFLIGVIILLSITTIGYRFLANKKYIPVIIGKQSRSDFLAKNLNFKFGDFYDTDGYFAKHIKPSDTVLLYGFHNLYYVDFPFIHESWVKKGDSFNYIAVQNGKLPQRFKSWKKIYENATTHVTLYSDQNKIWHY